MSLQRVAFAHLLASTIWATCSLPIGTIIRGHLVKVQLSLGAVVADPMHQLFAAKGGGAGVNAIYNIALIVPFKQQLMLRFFKRWLDCSPSKFTTATRTSAVLLHTARDLSLPLVAACWALPLCPELSASQRLFRCLGILVKVPVLCLSWCLGSNRVVLTDSFPLAVWAFGASCAVTHTCLPDMRASCWTVGA